MNLSPAVPVDQALLEEAADWVMTLHFGTGADSDRQAFQRWHEQSPAHREAWARAQKVLGTFDKVPPDIARNALQALHGMKRRRALRLLTLLMVAAPTGWVVSQALPWAEWASDAATSKGQRKSLTLADGTRVVLNTASAIDIAYTSAERRITLRAGEILVTTGSDPALAYRPFLVQTPQGLVQALGTRFSVRRLDDATRVAVFEHAVEVRPESGTAVRLDAGQQAVFNRTGVRVPTPVDDSAASWERGMLVARNMRLADVVAELARYRSGFLRCHPAVANLRVSGAISLTDTDAGLAALARVLPITVSRLSRYWVMVEPR